MCLHLQLFLKSSLERRVQCNNQKLWLSEEGALEPAAHAFLGHYHFHRLALFLFVTMSRCVSGKNLFELFLFF